MAQMVMFLRRLGHSSQMFVTGDVSQIDLDGAQTSGLVDAVRRLNGIDGIAVVLLAESDVPYDQLWEMDRINSDFKNTDVVIIVGANDVVNPAAREDTGPIAGMPILDVDHAQTVVVIKRSLSPGYAGIKNPLFDNANTLMLFSDAKVALEGMVKEVKDS